MSRQSQPATSRTGSAKAPPTWVLWVVQVFLIMSAMTAQAQQAKVVVVPMGGNYGLVASTQVANALKEALARKKLSSRVYYPLPNSLSGPGGKGQEAASLDAELEAFRQLEFEPVRQGVQRTVELTKASMHRPSSRTLYVKALHLLAAAELLDGQIEAAESAMNDALAISTRMPSKEHFGDPVRQLHKRLLGAKNQRGELKVSCSGHGVVWLDGKLRGACGETFNVRAANHWVFVVSQTGGRATAWVYVSAGGEKHAEVHPRPSGRPFREPALIKGLRQALQVGAAGHPSMAKVRRKVGAKEVLLVSAQRGCRPGACVVSLAWASGDRWKRRSQRRSASTAKQTAAALLGSKTQPTRAVVQKASECALDAECPLGRRCIDGQCQKPTSITQKWWFWTLVGTAIVGTAAGVAVPFLLPERPVIQLN